MGCHGPACQKSCWHHWQAWQAMEAHACPSKAYPFSPWDSALRTTYSIVRDVQRGPTHSAPQHEAGMSSHDYAMQPHLDLSFVHEASSALQACSQAWAAQACFRTSCCCPSPCPASCWSRPWPATATASAPAPCATSLLCRRPRLQPGALPLQPAESAQHQACGRCLQD